jgi:hypothetical protein
MAAAGANNKIVMMTWRRLPTRFLQSLGTMLPHKPGGTLPPAARKIHVCSVINGGVRQGCLAEAIAASWENMKRSFRQASQWANSNTHRPGPMSSTLSEMRIFRYHAPASSRVEYEPQ